MATLPPTAAAKVRSLNSQTVPSFGAWLRSQDLTDLDSDAPGGYRSTGDWFTQHVDVIGAPRPDRPQDVARKKTRHQAERQLAHHAQSVSLRQGAGVPAPEASQPELRHAATATNFGVASMALTAGTTSTSIDLQSDARRNNLQKSKSQPEFAVRRTSSQPSVVVSCLGCCLDPVGTIRRLRSPPAKCPARQEVPQGGKALAFNDPESALIIFDWDDTLLPTTFIMQHVDSNLVLPEKFEFNGALTAHAHLVAFVLRTARRIARVAIVTNSLSPWVLASGQRYLPGLDIQSLLNELDIPVYYARRHIQDIHVEKKGEAEYPVEIDRRNGGRIGVDIIHCKDGSLRVSTVEDGGLMAAWNAAHPDCEFQVRPGDRIVAVNGSPDQLKERCRQQQLLQISMVRDLLEPDPYVEAKRIDMDSCLCKFYPAAFWHRNVVSIGDSLAEQQALKQALKQSHDRPQTPQGAEPRPLCKTVNLLDRPTLEQLSSELRLLMVWLGHVVNYEHDFDLAMDGLDSLEKVLLKT